jgi:hypothetical protein
MDDVNKDDVKKKYMLIVVLCFLSTFWFSAGFFVGQYTIFNSIVSAIESVPSDVISSVSISVNETVLANEFGRAINNSILGNHAPNVVLGDVPIIGVD